MHQPPADQFMQEDCTPPAWKNGRPYWCRRLRQTQHPQLFQTAGLDLFAATVLAPRRPCGSRTAYAEDARRIVLVRSPGQSASEFWTYPYRNLPRPLQPRNELGEWMAHPEARSVQRRLEEPRDALIYR